MPFTNEPITVIDQTYAGSNKLDAFADTNALLELCGTYQRPFIHFWTTALPTLILGINDRHLPRLNQALQSLVANKYDYFLRNSGGLAVISDLGILNISLFIPQETVIYTVDDAYEIIKGLISMCFPQLDIASYEIEHSYCPGKYDLSVNGQKIAGIAQRRTHDAIVLMLYLSVSGDQDHRSDVVTDFYNAGDAYSQTDWEFPVVDKTTMTTIQQLGMPTVTLKDVENKFLASVSKEGISLDLTGYQELLASDEYLLQQKKQLRKMQLRNEQLPRI